MASAFPAESHTGDMRVGLLAHDFLTWQGGSDFLDVVARSLLAASHPPKLFLLIPARGPRIWARSLRLAIRARFHGRTKSFLWSPPSRDFFRSQLASLPKEVERVWLDIGHRPILRAATRARLDILLPAVHTLGRGFPFPWIGYAYDFQHHYLPQFFSEKDRSSRDRHFSAMFNDPPLVLVNSRAVAKDAQNLVSPRQAEIQILPFTPLVRSEWNFTDVSLVRRYGADPDRPLFMISNQFWPHKNHETVFEAAAILRRKGIRFHLLCTGAMDTPETNPVANRLGQRFSALLQEGTVRLLGWIPKEHQIGLFQQASAIIQPSLFEGGPGGGSAYHAVALGRPILLSDIPVNREVIAEDLAFFPANDATVLSKLMEKFVGRRKLPEVSWDQLQLRSDKCAKKCGEVLLGAVGKAIHAYRNQVALG